jgi:hypothetical protein
MSWAVGPELAIDDSRPNIGCPTGRRQRESGSSGGIIATQRASTNLLLAAGPVTGGDLVSTGTAKQRGACQGAEPCESSAIANLTANDETYALAA